MTPDEKFGITSDIKKFWQSLNLYSPLETIVITLSFITIIAVILIILNFALSAFFGNLAPAWWAPSLR